MCPDETAERRRAASRNPKGYLSVRGPMSDELQLVVSAYTRTLQLYLSPKYCHRIARQAEAHRTLARIFPGSENLSRWSQRVVERFPLVGTIDSTRTLFCRSAGVLAGQSWQLTVHNLTTGLPKEGPGRQDYKIYRILDSSNYLLSGRCCLRYLDLRRRCCAIWISACST
jgi:hypothetical protein